jgi:hypothetical protein
MNVRKKQVKIFEESNRGIISSSRIFGEGVDIPICDGVCFVDNKCSTIDIVQYVGRCLRKYNKNPLKISYVIVPFIMDDDNFFNDNNDDFLKLRRILKSLGMTDDMITENFVLYDCGKHVSNYYNGKECISKSYIGIPLNLTEFKQRIISKIFDRDGDPENRIRNKIIYENKRRALNNLDLIDTKKKCLEFLKSECESKTPVTNNWVKFCLGNDLFSERTNKYYYNKDEFRKACEINNISDFETYKLYYSKDIKLPSPEYINDGFYQDLDDKFNVNIILQSNVCLLEI